MPRVLPLPTERTACARVLRMRLGQGGRLLALREPVMAEVTLHLKDAATGLCVVCGADLEQRVSRWWLTNCWTGDRRHYKRQPTMRPDGDAVQPCGLLPPASKTPNAANQRPGTAPQTL